MNEDGDGVAFYRRLLKELVAERGSPAAEQAWREVEMIRRMKGDAGG